MRSVIRYSLFIITFLVVMSGCKRIPLHERSSRVILDISVELGLDHEIQMSYPTEMRDEFVEKIDGKMPKYHEVLFYDIKTHELSASHIVGSTGGVISVPTGDYHMVIYSFGTEATQIKSLNYRLEAEAYTTDLTKIMSSKLKSFANCNNVDSKSEIKGYDDDPIITEPDHLYVANMADVTIPAFTGKDETVTIHADSKSIMEVYSLEVLNIKGAENIDKVDAFVTGQVKSNYFGRMERNDNAATLYVALDTDAQNNRLYTVFCTFGKLPGEDNKIYLDITVTNSGGGQYRYIYDVTDQFDNPGNTDHKLIIDGGDIDIPDAASGGSGLNPSVDDWENEEIDVPLG